MRIRTLREIGFGYRTIAFFSAFVFSPFEIYDKLHTLRCWLAWIEHYFDSTRRCQTLTKFSKFTKYSVLNKTERFGVKVFVDFRVAVFYSGSPCTRKLGHIQAAEQWGSTGVICVKLSTHRRKSLGDIHATGRDASVCDQQTSSDVSASRL